MPPLLTFVARLSDGLPLVANTAPDFSQGGVTQEHKAQAKDILRGLGGTARCVFVLSHWHLWRGGTCKLWVVCCVILNRRLDAQDPAACVWTGLMPENHWEPCSISTFLDCFVSRLSRALRAASMLVSLYLPLSCIFAFVYFSSSARMSIEDTANNLVFHYLVRDSLCYLTLAEHSYPKRLAFLYLGKSEGG